MKRDAVVTQYVTVEIDETKFTPQFMAEFRQSMYHFRTIDDHIEHLAQLYARGIADEYSFIEGYGPAKDFGIKFETADQDVELE